jgi:mycothiol synthase
MRQLQMRRPHLKDLPPVTLLEGYTLRTYQEGDEQVWGEIMNTGIGSGWTVEKVKERLTQTPQFIADGLFFATCQGTPVGSACAWRDEANEWRHGIVHMVCVLPEHRGHRLGYYLTLAVLHWLKDHGFEDVSLLTDDWRLSAIKAYLQLGFEPVIDDEEMRERWGRVEQELK